MIIPHGSPAKLISRATGFPQSISPGVLSVVAKALHEAWVIICENPTNHLAPITPGNPEEDRYTDALCEILFQWLKSADHEVDGFTGDVFDTVVRGENLSNYNQSVINKQPDIVIRLANAPLVQARRYVGLFAETKIVSKSKHISAYTNEGVARFVRGDYAWTMQDGLMVAYQKPPHQPIAKLAGKLQTDNKLLAEKDSDTFLVTSGLPPALCGKSTHQRQWTYAGGDKPGVIRLWHLWTLELPD